MKYKSVRGMDDILPEDAGIWQYLENTARIDLESYGYREIRTPLVETTDVFVRSIGEGTDIVKKEMYTFNDRKERSLSLRPEGTAPIVRSYIEHSLDKKSSGAKFYYIGPMFRSERPQKGRTRQFHQIGVEVFGSASYLADAEVIKQLSDMLRLFGLENSVIKLNSLGCRKDKDDFSKKLRNYLKDKKNQLCDNCKTRIDKNVLRVLDCKKDACIHVMRNAPNASDCLCPCCKNHFEKLKASLDGMGVKFKETKNLVRGLDYYTGTVFEVTHPDLGSQDAIAAGGRYDNLVKDMGGAETPAIGYALGIERIILALRSKAKPVSAGNKETIYVASLGDIAKREGLKLADEVRRIDRKKIIVITSTIESSLKSQLRAADKNGAKWVLIIGENELKKNIVILKDMAGKKQDEISRDNIIKVLSEKLK